MSQQWLLQGEHPVTGWGNKLEGENKCRHINVYTVHQLKPFGVPACRVSRFTLQVRLGLTDSQNFPLCTNLFVNCVLNFFFFFFLRY
jgi:hypothetical protein